MKTLQNLSVILLVISFITLFVTTSYMLTTQNRNEIFLYVIEISILLVVISFGSIMILDDKINNIK